MVFKFDDERRFLVISFILALVIRLAVFFQNGNHAADGMYRTILAVNWLKAPYFITGDLWPPLQLYMSAFATMIFGNPFQSTRLVSLILGVLTIFPYYYLVKLLFDKRAAMLSTVILVFLSIHIQYSTYSMSEVPFAFFLITSLYFFFKFKKTEDKRMTNLVVSAIFLNMACMTRYEGWLFIPLLATLAVVENNPINKVYIRKDNVKYSLIFLVVALVFPIFWMIGNYNLYGDAFYGQTWSDKWIRTNTMLNPDSPWLNPPFYQKLTTWPGSVLYILNIVAIFAGIGLLLSLIRKKNLEFLSIFIILIGIFTYKLINVTMLSQARHIIMPILFIIPYFTIGLDAVLDYKTRFTNKNWKIPVMIIIIGFFIVTSSYIAMTKNSYITPGYVFDISKWIRTNVRSNETVLLDEYNWWGLHIIFFSGFNTTFTENYLNTFEYATDQIRIVSAGGKKMDGKIVDSYLKSNPTYLVYSPKGKLTNILNFSETCRTEEYSDYIFSCEYTTKNYNVYRLNRT